MQRALTSLFGLALLAACGPAGMSATLTLAGTLDGAPVDARIGLTSGGGNVVDGTNMAANRNTANQLALIAGLPAYTTLSGTLPLEPRPDAVELLLWTPPPLAYAGKWLLPEGSALSLELDLEPVRVVDLAPRTGAHWLEFQEPRFSSAGRLTLEQDATLHAPDDAAAKLTGAVHLEYHCHLQSKYFRHCGESIDGDGLANPLKLPYAEDTCPRELVQPYEASPVWAGTTLVLGDERVTCRETEGGRDGNEPAVLCYARRAGVAADGCTWTTHFVTDGAVYQFAVAGFADAACPRKTCNTYR